MDKITKKYREQELKKVSKRTAPYLTQIKLINEHGETKWLSLSNSELNAIKKVLVEGV